MTTPKEEAERLAKILAHAIQQQPCFNSSRWTPQTKSDTALILISQSIPLAELIEVARAANNNPYKTIEAEIALQDLQQTGKIEL